MCFRSMDGFIPFVHERFIVYSRRFRWATTLIEYLFTLLLLVSLIVRHVWYQTVRPVLERFNLPMMRKRSPVSFKNDTVLITGGE